MCAGIVVSIVALALTVAPAQAQAASPVLEFVPSGASFPIPFEAEGGAVSARLAEFDSIVNCADSEGEGALTGPRAAVADFVFTECKAVEGEEAGQECKSAGAEPEEIRAEGIDAELVYLDQAAHKVGMLLNPAGGVYMTFTCGGELVEAAGPFLSPVGEINKVTTSFISILRRNGASQLPSQYENASGEIRDAIPLGRRAKNLNWDQTGVELSFVIQTAAPLQIKVITAAEIEAKQREEEAAAAAAAKKRQDEEAAAAAAAKKRQEEEAAAAAAAKKLQEEEAALAERRRRAKQLSNRLKQCRKAPTTKQKRSRCERRAKNKLGPQKLNTQ